jgi:hypothetical protein
VSTAIELVPKPAPCRQHTAMTAPNFDEAILSEQTPGLARAFDEKSLALFTSHNEGRPYVEVYTRQSLGQLSPVIGQRSQERSVIVPDAAAIAVQGGEPSSPVLQTKSITSLGELREYCQLPDANEVFYVRQRNSYAELNSSLELFEVIFQERKVTAQFRDYFLYFGPRTHEIEIAPPAARFRRLSPPQREIDSFIVECLCGIRFIQHNGKKFPDDRLREWSLRQCAMYCRPAQAPLGFTWIFITLPPQCRKLLENYGIFDVSSGDIDVFGTMTLIYRTLSGNWRPYLVVLSMEVERRQKKAQGAAADNQGPYSLSESGQIQELMTLDDKISAAILAMRAVKDDVNRLLEAYKKQVLTRSFESTVSLGCQEIISDMERSVLELEALRTRLNGIVNLVSNLLSLDNGLALQQLGRASAHENEQTRLLNERMRILAERGAKETAAVTVLTFLTLVYLPLTVVTNFFSTSFIERSATADRIAVSQDWWILVAVAVPLTFATLFVWRVWSHRKARNLLAGGPQGQEETQEAHIKQS